MATRYWYGTRTQPVNKALRNLNLLGSATIGGDFTTNEIVYIDFGSSLATPRKNSLDQNMETAGFEFRREETV